MRIATLTPIKQPDGKWMLNVPPGMSANGRRRRLYFAEEAEAKAEVNRLRRIRREYGTKAIVLPEALAKNGDGVAAAAAELSGAESIALDIETYPLKGGAALDPWRGEIRLLTLRREGGPVHIIDLKAVGYDLGTLGPVLEAATILGHNIKFDLLWLRVKCGLVVRRSPQGGESRSDHGVGKRHVAGGHRNGVYGNSRGQWKARVAPGQFAQGGCGCRSQPPPRAGKA